jgi:hypothetical protein
LSNEPLIFIVPLLSWETSHAAQAGFYQAAASAAIISPFASSFNRRANGPRGI